MAENVLLMEHSFCFFLPLVFRRVVVGRTEEGPQLWPNTASNEYEASIDLQRLLYHSWKSARMPPQNLALASNAPIGQPGRTTLFQNPKQPLPPN
jgi:hypothetical protein